MSQTVLEEREFFESNISKINRMVEIILFVATIVPTAFIALTIVGIWYVSYIYSIALLFGTCICGVALHILNKYPKMNQFTMFLGLISCSAFIFAMGLNSIISISLAFSFVPFISCLYVNRKVTNIMGVLNYTLTLIAFAHRAFFTDYVKYHTLRFATETPTTWFISNLISLSIEFTFVFMISNYLTQVMKQHIHNLIKQNQELEDKNQTLIENQNETIEFISACINSRSPIIGQHVIHSQLYVELISKKMKEKNLYPNDLTDKKIAHYRTGAFCHDIGILSLPDSIIKSDKIFTEEEMAVMKTHTTEGEKLIKFLPAVENGMLNQIIKDIILYHHERWDGNGYPKGLKETEIPLCARIMTAADILDALISNRPYRKAFSLEEAMKIIEEGRGTILEPCIADTVLELKSEIERINKTFSEAESIS